jgi:hypothetical protein
MIFLGVLALIFLWRSNFPLMIGSLAMIVLVRQLAQSDPSRLITPRRKGTSRFISRYVVLEIVHKSGAFSGTIVDPQHQSHDITQVNDTDLAQWCGFYTEQDSASMHLAEAYLDRCFPRWRENLKTHTDAGTRTESETGAMSEQEAYDILGLTPEAGETDVRRVHRLLMKKLHPDQGGSTWIASRINQARDIIIKIIVTKHTQHSKHN